eukprot:maker-scaffold_18-snap-gene-4.39-mRNA-1 protein AED:0.00 eAED:0.00 QI:15/1/1/1/1/1/2/374/346
MAVNKDNKGPICWKCQGTGYSHKRIKTKLTTSTLKSSKVLKAECTVCKGQKFLRPKLTKLRKGATKETYIKLDNGDMLYPNEELCCLVKDFKIIQKVKGHRWSTDDLVTAYMAQKWFRKLNPAHRKVNYIDIGTGIGSVLLMMNALLQSDYDLLSKGVEAQEPSFLDAQRNINLNKVPAKLFNCNLKDTAIFQSPSETFDLITGTPPYFKVEKSELSPMKPKFGALPAFQQSQGARYETRGGVEVYISSAKKLLDVNGLFFVCQGVTPKLNGQRVFDACKKEGLKVLGKLSVRGKAGKPILFTVYCIALEEKELEVIEEQEIVVRGENNQRTKEYIKLMKEMGIKV